MERLGLWVVKRKYLILAAFMAVAAGAIWVGVDPGSDDDVLKFLPRSNPLVGRFYDVNERFGALHVAMVGIQTERVFARDFLVRLDALTNQLRDEVPGVHRVLSLTNVADFGILKGAGGGLQPRPLVDVARLPHDPDGWKALERRVMGKEHIVGQFISRDGRSVAVLCFLAPKGNTHRIVRAIKRVVRRHFPREELFWGGTPFVSAHIFEVTERDLRRLTPWAIILIVVLTFMVFRDLVGVLLTFVATIFGGLVTFSSMKLAHERVNIVLGSMPVILFAVASAYGIHFLVRYYHLREQRETGEALAGAFNEVGPAILAAGLTTVAGFISFLVMDIRPMRMFGLFTALGIAAGLAAALLFVPAVLAVTGRERRSARADSSVKRWVAHLSAWAYGHRGILLLVAGFVGAVGFFYSTRVKLAVETSQFFKKGSEPDLADRFFQRDFGGSMYVQIHLKTDLDEPVVLREIRRVAALVRNVPHVSAVQHVALPYELVNEAMTELRRVPDDRKQVETLSAYVLSDPSAYQLMTGDKKQALVHIKVDTSHAETVDRVVARLRTVLRRELPQDLVVVNVGPKAPVKVRRIGREILAHQTADLMVALLENARIRLPEGARSLVGRVLAGTGGLQWSEKDRQAVAARLLRYFRSKECVIPLPPPKDGKDPALVLATALAGLGPGASERALEKAAGEALAGVLGSEDAGVLAAAAQPYLEDAWRLQKGEALLDRALGGLGLTADELPRHLVRRLKVALLDLEAPTVGVPPQRAEELGLSGRRVPMQWVLTGMPVLYEGLAKSVQANQIKSLIASAVLVLFVVALIFRSGWAAGLAILPAGITVMMVFGYMGWRGLYLDMSTSMIASIALGVGIDYAIHFLVWWRRRAALVRGDAERAALEGARGAGLEAGISILANAVMVAAAFLVLTTGDAAPMTNFGGMTAAAMGVAAASAFLVLPVLAGPALVRRWAWRSQGEATGEEVSQ